MSSSGGPPAPERALLDTRLLGPGGTGRAVSRESTEAATGSIVPPRLSVSRRFFRGLTLMSDQFDQVSLESGAVTAGQRMAVVLLRSQSLCVDTFSLCHLGNPGPCLSVLHLPPSLPSAPNRSIPPGRGGSPSEARCSLQRGGSRGAGKGQRVSNVGRWNPQQFALSVSWWFPAAQRARSWLWGHCRPHLGARTRGELLSGGWSSWPSSPHAPRHGGWDTGIPHFSP